MVRSPQDEADYCKCPVSSLNFCELSYENYREISVRRRPSNALATQSFLELLSNNFLIGVYLNLKKTARRRLLVEGPHTKGASVK